MPKTPKQSLTEIADRGTQHLESVIAIDSHSDERSETIPSTEGQERLSAFLGGFFEGLGFRSTWDASANLMVEIPGNVEGAPKLALMVHIDTSRGTEAVSKLEVLEEWSGDRIPYPSNPRLQVCVDNYPETSIYTGQDLLFGPGNAPIGLDDKLGMAEMMTMAELLANNPELPRGDIMLVCRPDEEIGRMEAVYGLAEALEERGVTRGYTVDGLAPFEVNTENFNAARGQVRMDGRPLELEPQAKARALTLRLYGAKSHGATAKSEGYLNATVVFTRALAATSTSGQGLGPDAIIPVGFQSDHNAEVDATMRFVLRGQSDEALDAAEATLLAALDAQLEPHRWKGARVELGARDHADADATYTDEITRLLAHLEAFLDSGLNSGSSFGSDTRAPSPLLSEDSEHDQGYSNPYFVEHDNATLTLEYRLRDFTDEGLAARKRHLEAVCSEGAGEPQLTISDQYVNMGPSLAPFPELVTWAEEAARAMDQKVLRRPIRGGTGVDPFLEKGIPIANVGTGYFAPESEKEFTSKQTLANHALWLLNLVQVVAASAGS